MIATPQFFAIFVSFILIVIAKDIQLHKNITIYTYVDSRMENYIDKLIDLSHASKYPIYACLYSSDPKYPILLENHDVKRLVRTSSISIYILDGHSKQTMCPFQYMTNISTKNKVVDIVFIHLDINLMTDDTSPRSYLAKALHMVSHHSISDYDIICNPKNLNIRLNSHIDLEGSELSVMTCSGPVVIMNSRTALSVSDSHDSTAVFNTTEDNIYNPHELLQLQIAYSTLSHPIRIINMEGSKIDVVEVSVDSGGSSSSSISIGDSTSDIHEKITHTDYNIVGYDKKKYELFAWDLESHRPHSSTDTDSSTLANVNINSLSPSQNMICALQFPVSNAEMQQISDLAIELKIAFFITPSKASLLNDKSEEFLEVIRGYEVSVQASNLGGTFDMINHFNQVTGIYSITLHVSSNLMEMVNGTINLSLHVHDKDRNSVCNMYADKVKVLRHDYTMRSSSHPQRPVYPETSINNVPAGSDIDRALWEMTDKSRTEFGFLLNRLGTSSGATTVEIGVLRGEFSRMFLDMSPMIGRHIMIDPWSNSMDKYYDLLDTADERIAKGRFTQALHSVEAHGSKAMAVQSTSTEAADLFPDAFADLVFIDALHDYMSCMQDMRAWWHKVKPGGVLAGHDYNCFVGVAGAVLEFGRKMNVTVYETNSYDMDINGTHTLTCSSWYLVKPA
jgi:hypothetical protein